MPQKIKENEILEYLNESFSVRGFFISAVDIFEKAIQTLIERVFLKNDFAVQSVVGPLLHNSGPLGELSVRLKLLFGLGVIPQTIYQDIEGMIKLKTVLNNDSAEYKFTDPVVVNVIRNLHLSKNMNMDPFEAITMDQDDADLAFYQMQVDRQQQVIKSSLALEILTLCNSLDIESPL